MKRFIIMGLVIFSALSGCRKDDPKSEEIPVQSNGTTPLHKVLYVDSYNRDIPWVREIMTGMTDAFRIEMDDYELTESPAGLVNLRIFHMDTKNNKAEDYIKQSAVQAREIIEEWKPDVVIASDDNASKYLIAPYFIGDALPFVFCGVNWDASVYGFPAENITGMVEVQLIDQIIEKLSPYGKGTRIGFIKGESLSSLKEGENFQKMLGYRIIQKFAVDFEDWKRQFIEIQQEADILLVGNLDDVGDWDKDADSLKRFMVGHTVIPTGAWDPWMSESVLITIAQTGREQGKWAAETALRILDGVPPSQIPIAKNKMATVYLNMALANKMNIRFPMELLDTSHLVNESEQYHE